MEKNILYDKSQDLVFTVYKKYAEVSKKDKDTYLLHSLLQEVAQVAVQLYSLREYSSTRSFTIKLYVAKRGVVRASCWLTMLRELAVLPVSFCEELEGQLIEIIKMITASISTVTNKKKNVEKPVAIS